MLTFMPSGPEWIILLVIVLVIFGGTQVPKLARNFGRAQREFKDGLAEGQRENERRAATETAGANTNTKSDAGYDE